MSPAEKPRALRADARKNRERILEAAELVFARDGLDASLDAVAAEAGVGVGTVYRRFPDRQRLIEELFESKIDRFVELAEDCSRDPDAWNGLVRFITEASRIHGENVGLRQMVMGPGSTSEMMESPRRRIAPVVAGMIERAKAEGKLRRDFDVLDVPMIEMMLARLNDLTGPVSPALWERMLTLVIDGLRTERSEATQMPVGPITPAEYTAAITAAKG